MLYHDSKVSRQLAGERHAELAQAWGPADAEAPAPVEAGSERRRLLLVWLPMQLRRARHNDAPERHAS